MPELALDNDQRDAFVRHLDRLRVLQLARREATLHPRRSSRVMQLLAGGRRLPAATCCRRGSHTAPRRSAARGGSRGTGGRSHAHRSIPTSRRLPPLPRRTSTGPRPRSRSISWRASASLADPQPSTPQQHDQRANPVAVGTVPDRAHDSDDLLDGRRVGRILLVLVARRAAAVVAGHRRRRAATPGSVQQNGFPESSLWMG
jgi:hypothetical protein